VREILLGWTGEASAAGDVLTLPGRDVAVLRC